ncbi:MAG: EF-hand domain-containing protein [Verrucomicrobiota bacterium]
MKIFRTIFFTLLGAGIAAGAPPEKPGPGSDRKPPNFGRFFQAADTNGDGAVSAAEFAALERIAALPEEKRNEIFKRFDKDGDGMIRQDEMRPPRRPNGKGQPFPRLAELDQNKDGEVTLEEFLQGEFAKRLPEERREAFFKRLDRNGDGVISAADRPRGRKPPGPERGSNPKGRSEASMRMLDKDKDGSLSFEEFTQSPRVKDLGEDEQEDRFEELDKNGDLRLDRKELSAGMEGGREAKGKQDRKGPKPRRDAE